MLGADEGPEMLTNTRLSFKPFIDFVRLRLQDKNSVRKEVLAYIQDRLKAWPQLEDEVPLDQLPRYKALLDMLYVVLTSVVEDEKTVCWGLCVPMSPIMFYGSNALYEILSEANDHDLQCGLEDEDYEEFKKGKLETFYSFILNRFYGIQYHVRASLVRSLTDSRNQLTHHFSINLNTDFVEVNAIGSMPEVDTETMRTIATAEDSLGILKRMLPMDMFAFSGFTIMTITDVTPQYALESIRNSIAKNSSGAENRGFPEVVRSLKELAGSNEVAFNILPLFKINGKLIDEIDAYCQSILFTFADRDEHSGTRWLSMIKKFVSDPVHVFYGDLDAEYPSQQEVARTLQRAGIKSYAMIPVFYNKDLVGAIEVYSVQKGLLDEKMLSLLAPARELLAQLMQNSLTAFENEIEAVIKEKFTSLQPSVQWKFNEVAWHYLQRKRETPRTQELEEISFKHVYPLYGAVDIRNSTIERNAALHKDISLQFDVLLKVLQELKEKTSFWLLDEKIYAAKQWRDMIKPNASLFNQEARMNDFLENDIITFLVQFTDKQPELSAIAGPYFRAIDEQTGIAHKNRQQMESSITKVISLINTYFDQLKEEIQHAYPCYFEKFRTDGVEYDIYIGQSITPDRPYSDIYLKNLRLMQVSTMAAIAKYTHAMLPDLAVPVETTQLIFVHSHQIDICFRRDEKRFDVEGAYNIRYQIIKKRIDKVQLKDSAERLTQPNKIALVYFNQKEADEYVAYIRYLQGENILKNDLEYLDLEELQGVSGLKALRVGVNMD